MERETTRYLGLSSLYARAREEGHFKWSAFVGGGAKGTCFDYIYTVLHMFTQLLFWVGNQGRNQNFDQSLLHKKL